MPTNNTTKDFTLGQPTRRAEKRRDTSRQFQLATALYKDAVRKQVENEEQAKVLLRVSQLLDEREMAFQNLLLNQAASRLHQAPPAASGIPPMSEYSDVKPAFNPMLGEMPQGLDGMSQNINLRDPALMSRFAQ